MTHRTVIAADIAKSSFQCVQFNDNQQTSKNRSYSRRQFEKLIRRPKPMKLVMETCGGAQHWARLAKQHGHEVVLIPPRFVTGFRQGQKTDANDTVAIFEASRSSNLRESVQMTAAQQGLGTLHSVRNGFIRRKTQTSNAIRGHLMEFGFTFGKGFSQLKRQVPSILEDAGNGLPLTARMAIGALWEEWLRVTEKVVTLDREMEQALSRSAVAKEVMKLEGIGPVCTAQLLVALGDGRAFENAKAASAFTGVSPKQYSTGGKIVIVGIGKHVGVNPLRSHLIQGARAVIQRVRTRGPNSDLERWLADLIARRGENRAAVALANKNVRRAWAIIRHERGFNPGQVRQSEPSPNLH